jgi:hydrogenase-4 component B
MPPTAPGHCARVASGGVAKTFRFSFISRIHRREENLMMEPTVFFFLFLALCFLGVILSLLLPERLNPLVLAGVASLAAVSILLASGMILLMGGPFRVELWRPLPEWGMMVLAMDRLSALFVFVTGLVLLPVSIFSAGYMPKYLGRYNLKTFGAFYHVLFAATVLVLVSGDIFSFLLAWECASIFCYLLINFEHDREDTTRAGFLMLAMSEAGTLAAAVGLLLLVGASGALELRALRAGPAEMSQTLRWSVFLLSFFGFGVKAGLVPVNSWLPRAHPAAPGNVSAVLSGVIVNLGIYGIMRVNVDLLPMTSAGPGLVVLLVGALSALIGVLYANVEHNLKTMLAHHTVEQMGIVTIGLGAGLVFVATGHPVIATMAFIAAVYHMTNHSLYKALLFVSAASVDTTVGVRDIDRLGGLIKRMPWTAFFFLIGAISLVALPPFNGFVSEWLTFQVLLRSAELSSTGTKIVFALCGAGLALTAALAVTCFVKAFAMSFLGAGRSGEVAQAREAPRSMVAPMAVLAALCLLLGVLPTYVIPVLDEVVTPLTGTKAVDALVPPFFATSPQHQKLSPGFAAEFRDLGAQTGQGILPGRGLVILHRGSEKNPVVFAMSTSYSLVMLVLLLGGSYLCVHALTRARRVVRKPAWDGGVRRLLPEMTYTATGFSNPVRVVFNAIFRPSTVEDTKETVAEHFRTAIKNGRKEEHIVDRSVFRPVIKMVESAARLFGQMHSGSVNAYAAYILMCLICLLVIQLLL